MKKILALLLSSTTGLIIIAIIILVPILMIMDFFGANITDGYVEDNMEYADQYKSVVNKNFKKNAVSATLLSHFPSAWSVRCHRE